MFIFLPDAKSLGAAISRLVAATASGHNAKLRCPTGTKFDRRRDSWSILGFVGMQIFTELRPVVFFVGGAEPAIAEDFAVSIAS